ncbi:MAG: MerR family DNA-binding transcriptional regulator [Sphingomonadales bacterium]
MGDITYTISDLAREFDVTPRTIRFYENQGLVRPARLGQNRVYSAGDRARLAWILRGRRVGFTLADIGELLDLYDVEDGRLRQREQTLAKCRERVAVLERQRDDINATIQEIGNFCDTLEHMIADSTGHKKAG